MTIRTKIKLCLAIAITLALASTLTVFYRGQLLEESFRERTFFDQVIQGTSELNYLALGYSLYQGDRYKTQWQRRYTSLEKLLRGAESNGDGDKTALTRMLHDAETIKGLFEQVVFNSDSARSLTGIARDMKLESNERVIARLLARAQVMGNDAALLAEASNRRVFIIQKRVFLLIMTLSLAMVLVIAFIAFILNRSVIGGLKTLEEGAGAVSRGDLDHRIAIRSGDEIGTVSHAFNDMSAKLKETYRELRKSHAELEQRVEERTADLQESTKQLKEANKELEDFSYTVSHDLRAPLRAIDGYSRMILKKQGSNFDEETLRQFNLIRDNAQMMGQLIDDLLSFSRLGRKELNATPVDMESMANDVWNEIKNLSPDRELYFKIANMAPASGDPTLIRQVLINLLANAVKFTRDRKPAVIEAGGYTEGSDLIYYVKDNGIGFDMKYYDKLFGVFERLHPQEDYEGTGVGLAIVRRIIHRHGGRIWAEGIVDGGACFYFTLRKAVLTQ